MSASVPPQCAPKESAQQTSAPTDNAREETAKKQPMGIDQAAEEESQAKQNGAQHNHQPSEQAETEPQPKPPQKHTALLFCGSTKWDLMGRKSVPKAVEKRGGSDAGQEYLAPQRLQFPAFKQNSFSAVYSGSCSAHLVLLDDQGAAYGLGRNNCAQLGFSDMVSRNSLQQFELPLKEHERIVHAACGRSHTLLVSSLGRVFAAGANSHGQLGTGSRSAVTGWGIVSIPNGMRVIQASAGSDFSMFLCDGGDVYAVGSGEHGHLGNGRTGERIETAGKVVFDTVSTPSPVLFPQGVKIQQIASGSNHTLALDQKGKVWSWGWGGYGRLGHRQPKDELTPRMIATFDGDHYKLDFVAAGSTCSFAVQKSRHSIFFWGVTKKSSESFMYPKPLFDLQGWLVRSVAAGVTSVVVSAEQSVISWGPSPTYGELGYGDGPKSSTKPKKMDSLEGLEVRMLAMGIGFTAMIVEYTEEEEAIIKKLGEVVIEGGTPHQEEKDEPKGKRKAPANLKKKKKRRR